MNSRGGRILRVFGLCWLLLVAGCQYIGVNQSTEDVLLIVSARTLGERLAAKDPAIIPTAKAYCAAMIRSDDESLQPLIDTAIDFLLERYREDPLFVSNMKTAMTILKIKQDGKLNYDRVRLACGSFYEGLVIHD